MIHLDLAYPVTLHGKGLIDDQTVEIGDLALVERMMMGGGYQGNGLLTDLINGEVLSNSLLRSLLSALGESESVSDLSLTLFLYSTCTHCTFL